MITHTTWMQIRTVCCKSPGHQCGFDECFFIACTAHNTLGNLMMQKLKIFYKDIYPAMLLK